MAELPGRDLPGQASDHRNADAVVIMEGAFGGQTVLAKVMSVVASEDDQRIFRQAAFIEMVDDLADVFVHAADHAVIAGDVFGQLIMVVQVRMKAVAAAAVWLLPGGEVGIGLLRQLQVRWIGLVLARRDRRHGDIARVVHGVPGFGDEVFRMRIEEARPEEERLVGVIVLRDERVAALGDPGIVMKLLGDQPFAAL